LHELLTITAIKTQSIVGMDVARKNGPRNECSAPLHLVGTGSRISYLSFFLAMYSLMSPKVIGTMSFAGRICAKVVSGRSIGFGSIRATPRRA
jgi:hypothetical protein